MPWAHTPWAYICFVQHPPLSMFAVHLNAPPVARISPAQLLSSRPLASYRLHSVPLGPRSSLRFPSLVSLSCDARYPSVRLNSTQLASAPYSSMINSRSYNKGGSFMHRLC